MRRSPLPFALLVTLLGIGCGDEGRKAPPPVASKAGVGFAYVDVASELGYELRNRTGEDTTKQFILEAMPPGIAVADFDGDGYMDLYCPNGTNITRYDPKLNQFTLLPEELAPRNALYWNRKGKRFEDGARKAGVDDSSWSFGAVAGDLDNDGDPDLYLCNWGPNRLYLNRGDSTFAEVAAAAGVVGDPRHWSAGACFFDYDRDGDLDIYVAQYADIYDMARDPQFVTVDPDGKPRARTCDWRGLQVYCGPLGLRPQNDVLFKNLLRETGKLRFENVTRKAGMWIEENARMRTDSSAGPYYGFQPVAWDINGDGWQDLLVANDSVNNLVWINQGDGTFVDQALETGLGMSQTDYAPQASMGVGIGDVNQDGQIDVVITEFSHDHFNLLVSRRIGEGDVVFDEMAMKAGLRELTFFKLGWGTLIYDADLDGDNEIFYACGHVYPEVDRYPAQGTTYRQRNMLVVCEDPKKLRFRDVSGDAGPGLLVQKCTRAAVRIDYDNDGDLDIATTELNDRPALLRCDLDPELGHHWLELHLRGKPAERVPLDPAGARVRVTTGDVTQTQVLCFGSSFQASEDPRLHFGLGKSAQADRIEILWPNGRLQTLKDVAGDRLHVVEYAPD